LSNQESSFGTAATSSEAVPFNVTVDASKAGTNVPEFAFETALAVLAVNVVKTTSEALLWRVVDDRLQARPRREMLGRLGVLVERITYGLPPDGMRQDYPVATPPEPLQAGERYTVFIRSCDAVVRRQFVMP
jgi:hypothetical protein